MDARHHGRLVILQLRIIRQILGEVPDQPRGGGDANQEQDGSGGEQETHEPHEQAHYRSSVSTLAPGYPAFSSAKPCAATCRSCKSTIRCPEREFRTIPHASRWFFIVP